MQAEVSSGPLRFAEQFRASRWPRSVLSHDIDVAGSGPCLGPSYFYQAQSGLRQCRAKLMNN